MSTPWWKDPLAELTTTSLNRVLSDWGEMFGVTGSVQRVFVLELKHVTHLDGAMKTSSVAVKTQVEGSCDGPFQIVFASEMVHQLVDTMMMVSPQNSEERKDTPPSEEDLEVFKELANLLCGSFNLVFEKLRRTLRVSQSVDHLKVGVGPDCEAAELPGQGIALCKVITELQGRTGYILQIMPLDLAHAIAKLSATSKVA